MFGKAFLYSRLFVYFCLPVSAILRYLFCLSAGPQIYLEKGPCQNALAGTCPFATPLDAIIKLRPGRDTWHKQDHPLYTNVFLGLLLLRRVHKPSASSAVIHSWLPRNPKPAADSLDLFATRLNLKVPKFVQEPISISAYYQLPTFWPFFRGAWIAGCLGLPFSSLFLF